MITNFFLFCNFVAIKLGASIGWARVGAEVRHKKKIRYTFNRASNLTTKLANNRKKALREKH